MDHLSLLYLHDNAITDMGTALKALKSLMMLDISSNQLTKVLIALQICHPCSATNLQCPRRSQTRSLNKCTNSTWSTTPSTLSQRAS